MKAAREKAEFWLNDNVAGWEENHLVLLEILLRVQDRDTRHACAEAVMGLEACSTSNDNAIYLGPDYIVNKALCADDAFAACMNVKAV